MLQKQRQSRALYSTQNQRTSITNLNTSSVSGWHKYSTRDNKPQIFIIFNNNRIEHHFNDSSILQYKNSQAIYISPKGIKSTLSLEQIYKNQELMKKFTKMLQKFNLYSTQNCSLSLESDDIVNNQQNVDKNQKNIVKMNVKINQFWWKFPQIQQTQSGGYMLKSDCKYASLQLKKDLYIVQVKYLQLIKSENTYAYRKPNMTKILLQKYNHSYSQFPTLSAYSNNKQNKPSFYYRKQTKKFCIFNTPKQWRYPLHLIWNSLIEYQVVKHRFCFIDYHKSEMQVQNTIMPQFLASLSDLDVKDKTNQNNQLISFCKRLQNNTALPILGKINHQDKCILLQVDGSTSWIQDNIRMLHDGYGFWFIDQSYSYKKYNKQEIDYQCHPNALPPITRFQNQPQRSMQFTLKLLSSYIAQNKKLEALSQQQIKRLQNTKKFDNNNTLIFEINDPQIGYFKAYSNGIVIVNFIDRTMLTLDCKRMQIKIISKNGETYFIDMNKNYGINYYDNQIYIQHAVSWMEKVFYPQQHRQKQQYSRKIQQFIETGEVSKQISSIYLKL